ncbi:unnamed protein product [Colias eurytheme]|nr:unnamed protein product [Colias eurytheme]
MQLSNEARVYCEDLNATPWKPYGYSCPVLCQSVLNAIHRLKIMDYKKIVFQELSVNQNINELNEIIINRGKLKKPTQDPLYSDYGHENYKHISRKMDYDYKKYNYDNTIEAIDLIKHVMAVFKMADCHDIDNIGGNLNCSRKFNVDNEFVNIMTNILNKYAKSTFQFTEEMTEVILSKLFTNSTHAHNMYDVNKLLKYLRKAVRVHTNHDNKYVITLKPRNCLSISVPGCFCKPGYVENSGQCVEPSKCLIDKNQYKYLNRIIVQ